MRRGRPGALLATAVLVLTGCATSGGWQPYHPGDLPFDGEQPAFVQVRAGTDTIGMPHPIIRGDSLVARYGYGAAVSLAEVQAIQTAEKNPGQGIGTGGVIVLTALTAVVALAVWVSTWELGGL